MTVYRNASDHARLPAPPPARRTTCRSPCRSSRFCCRCSDQDLHGYAIIQDIRRRTAEEVSLTASTLYAAIKRLLDAGLIEERDGRPRAGDDDPRRRYYGIRPAGLDVARLEAARLERAVKMARQKRLTPRKA